MGRTTLSLAFLVLVATAGTKAADYGPVPTQLPIQNAPRLTSPPGPVYSLGAPSPQRPPIETHTGLFSHHGVSGQPTLPADGWTGYGFGGVPTYQWGYFGARYHAVKIYHRGYYGHRMSFGYRRGY